MTNDARNTEIWEDEKELRKYFDKSLEWIAKLGLHLAEMSIHQCAENVRKQHQELIDMRYHLHHKKLYRLLNENFKKDD